MSTGDLLGQAGAPEQTTRNELTALVKAGRIVRPRHGWYELPPQGYVYPTAAGSKSGTGSTAWQTTDMVPVALASVHASAGPGSIVFEPEVAQYLVMHGPSLRRITGSAPDRVVLVQATGDSMVPDIMPGDILWVVKRDGEGVKDGTIYIWRSRYDGILVKRARIMPDGSTAMQGNRDPEPVGRILPFDTDPPFEIIGRVARIEKPA